MIVSLSDRGRYAGLIGGRPAVSHGARDGRAMTSCTPTTLPTVMCPDEGRARSGGVTPSPAARRMNPKAAGSLRNFRSTRLPIRDRASVHGLSPTMHRLCGRRTLFHVKHAAKSMLGTARGTYAGPPWS